MILKIILNKIGHKDTCITYITVHEVVCLHGQCDRRNIVVACHIQHMCCASIIFQMQHSFHEAVMEEILARVHSDLGSVFLCIDMLSTVIFLVCCSDALQLPSYCSIHSDQHPRSTSFSSRPPRGPHRASKQVRLRGMIDSSLKMLGLTSCIAYDNTVDLPGFGLDPAWVCSWSGVSSRGVGRILDGL